MFSKDIDIEYNILLKNKIPLLINDEVWKKLFGDIDVKSIVSCKKDLEALVEKQKKADKDLTLKKVEKKKVMAKILKLSDVINNDSVMDKIPDAVQLLEQCQKEIYDINEEIEKLTFESEMIPKEVKQANFNLLKATIKYAYKGLKEDQKNLESLNEEIEIYREKLRDSIEKKNDFEERINAIYSFLHSTLGGKEMEKLDNDMLY